MAASGTVPTTPIAAQNNRKGKTMGYRRITNQTNLKAFILEAAIQAHPHWKVTRVAKTYLDSLEHKFREIIHKSVKLHPPQGKTVRDLY
jgi:hypothetical protein